MNSNCSACGCRLCTENTELQIRQYVFLYILFNSIFCFHHLSVTVCFIFCFSEGQENRDLNCLKVTDIMTTTLTSEQYTKGTKGGGRGVGEGKWG